MNSLSVRNQQGLKAKSTKSTLTDYFQKDAIKNKINQMVGASRGPRFIASVVGAVSLNPQLAECEHASILSCALQGEALNLSPSPQLGHYYMVPFKKKAKIDKNGEVIEPETVTATFIPGYKGYIQLAIRSGQYKKMNVIAVKEGELRGYNPLTEELNVVLIEDEEEREKAKTIGYYAFFEYINGFTKSIYWSHKKMLLHADRYSQAFNKDKYADLIAGKIPEKEMWKYSSYWYKDFDSMAYKTLLRQLISKWGIMSIDMQTAFEADIMAEKMAETQDFVSDETEEESYAEVIEDQNEQQVQEEVFAETEEAKVEDKDPFDE